jgi:hypothetical protein
MFVLGADGEPVLDPPDRPAPTLRERLGLMPTVPPIAEIEQTRPRLTPAGRVGHGLDEPRRSGFPEEILVTLHADPVAAARRALDGAVFERPPSRLQVDRGSLRARRNDLLWRCTLRTGRWRRRPAMIRLYGSPSSNVTVLTLSPDRPRRIAARGFLRVGLRTMTELRDRLAAEVLDARPTP